MASNKTATRHTTPAPASGAATGGTTTSQQRMLWAAKGSCSSPSAPMVTTLRRCASIVTPTASFFKPLASTSTCGRQGKDVNERVGRPEKARIGTRGVDGARNEALRETMAWQPQSNVTA